MDLKAIIRGAIVVLIQAAGICLCYLVLFPAVDGAYNVHESRAHYLAMTLGMGFLLIVCVPIMIAIARKYRWRGILRR